MYIWDWHQLHVQVKKTGWSSRTPPRKDGWLNFFNFLTFTKTLLMLRVPDRSPANASSRRCGNRALKRPLRLALVYHWRHVSMHRQTERREQNRSAARQTPVTVATASHTHMRWIKGQGSWVVLVEAQWCSVCHHRDFQ